MRPLKPDGEWSYARFERWLAYRGLPAWPRLNSGKLDLDGDAFRMMSPCAGIEELHALRDRLRVIVPAKLPIGRDGRNRPSLFPFGTATGRNAHGSSLYNARAGLRSFARGLDHSDPLRSKIARDAFSKITPSPFDADAGLRRSHRQHDLSGLRKYIAAAQFHRQLVSISALHRRPEGSADRTWCRAECLP
jgi:hypothetical protein